MPELPEVEITVRKLRAPLLGRTITGITSYWPRHIDRPELEELQQRLPGRRIEAIDRRGKYLVFSLSEGETLIIHLRMTGHLSVVDAGAPLPPHTHTVFNLDGGEQLRFSDTRKFGRVYLVEDPQEVLGKLGPEPLAADFDVATLRQRLEGRSKIIKSLLLDQTFIAGVGNIYADETLFYAGLHPQRPADSLQPAEVEALHQALRRVLQMGIDREGASVDRFRKPDGSRGTMQEVVAVYGRTGEPCHECGTPIERVVISGRSSHFCPRCQK